MSDAVAERRAPGVIGRARLPLRELAGTAWQGMRARRMRAVLSALGIAIGIGAMVAVVGVSASAQANLIAEIDRLGTNLLTVSPGTGFLGQNETLPATAAPMVAHMLNVNGQAAVYQLPDQSVYRTPYVPVGETGGIGIDASGDQLPSVVGTTLASGHFLDAVSDRVPEVVLGAQAAEILQIPEASGHILIDLGNRWFTVIGILRPAVLDSALDSDVFVSLPMARRLLGAAPNPTEIYVRADQNDVTGVSNLLAPTVDPQDPSGVDVARPSDALEARAAAKGQFTTLLLGLGAVTLLVGAIGIANIMVISVLERRGEIGWPRPAPVCSSGRWPASTRQRTPPGSVRPKRCAPETSRRGPGRVGRSSWRPWAADDWLMDPSAYALVHGLRRTRGTLADWRAHPGTVLRRWLLQSLGVACLLLAATWLVAVLWPGGTRGGVIVAPPLVVGGAGDVMHILAHNLLVLAFHALACTAGFIAGSSLPLQAAHKTGLSRWVHERGRPFALAFVVGATLFSLTMQAYTIGRGVATVAGGLAVSPTMLLAALLPHALPELVALFLPLAAWIVASRRGDWDQLLAATFVTSALALPVLVVAALWEVYGAPHVVAALIGRV